MNVDEEKNVGPNQSAPKRKRRERPAHRVKEEHVKVFKNAQETFYAMLTASRKKCDWPMDKFFFQGFMAGMMMGVGGTLSISIGYAMPNSDPGVSKLMFAALFPIGLLIILMMQYELWTGNLMIMLIGFVTRQVNLLSFITSIVVIYGSNWAGAVTYAWWVNMVCDLFHGRPVSFITSIQSMAVSKTTHTFGDNLALGMLGNYMVCMAVVFFFSGEDNLSKIVGVYLCIMTFVASGYEHSIANMFYCSLSIFMGSTCTYGRFVWKNLIPVSIGNFIGGGFFVGLALVYDFYAGVPLPAASFDPKAKPAHLSWLKWSFVPFFKDLLGME